MNNLDCINRLINAFTNLPAVGYKTAERYAYKIIESDDAFVTELCTALKDVKHNVKFCSRCGNFSTGDLCTICEKRGAGADVARRVEVADGGDPQRGAVVCVVKDPRDVIAIEKSGAFRGTYHVLHGVISPLDKKGPDDINLKSLLVRVRDENITEVIIATNPDVEGEATANYIAMLLKPLGVRVTRIAQGLQSGANIEYADQVSLSVAINNRVVL